MYVYREEGFRFGCLNSHQDRVFIGMIRYPNNILMIMMYDRGYNSRHVEFFDHGFNVALKKGEIHLEDEFRIHICFYNDECYAREYDGELCKDLTNEMFDWYLANRCDDAGEDRTIKFTEVWYDVIAGELIEIKRKETTYSDDYFRK